MENGKENGSYYLGLKLSQSEGYLFGVGLNKDWGPPILKKHCMEVSQNRLPLDPWDLSAS